MLKMLVVGYYLVLWAPSGTLVCHCIYTLHIAIKTCQFAPVDTPVAVNAFLEYWKPYALVLVENELWPNLVLGASANGVMLALINARMSIKSFNNWSRPVVRLLASLMLSKFSLILPLV
ncbi:putative transferase [Helianthus annuus]|nr:putative transferase [Helianthus annuus]